MQRERDGMRRQHREASLSASLAPGQAATGKLIYGGCRTLTRQTQFIRLFSLEMFLPLTYILICLLVKICVFETR